MTSKSIGGFRMSIKTFTLRFTEEQLEFIGEKAKEMGISKNGYKKIFIAYRKGSLCQIATTL